MQIERSAIETHYWNYYVNASVGDEELMLVEHLRPWQKNRQKNRTPIRRKVVAMRASYTRHDATSDKSPPADRIRLSYDTVNIKKDGTEGQYHRNDYWGNFETDAMRERFKEIQGELRANVLIAYSSRTQIGDRDNG